jgi:prevent-host-death family protein
MKSVSIAELRDRLPRTIHEAESEPIRILRRGKPVAVIVPWESFRKGSAHGFQALQQLRKEYADVLFEDGEEWLPRRRVTRKKPVSFE